MKPSVATVLKQSALVAGTFVVIEAVYAIAVGQIEYQGAILIQGIPFKGLLMDQWREGTVPLWTSFLGAGQPLLADGSSVPLDPRHLLFLPFSDVNGYIAAEVFTRALSASVAFVYLRGRLGVSAWPAFLGTLLFLSSTIWFEEGTPFTTGAQLMPGFIWLSELLYEQVTVKRIVVLGAAWGLFLVTNSPAYAPFLALACAVWCPLLAGFRARGLDRRRLLSFGVGYSGAVAIGIVLAAVVVVPILELGALSNRGGEYREEPWALQSLLGAFLGTNPQSAVYPATTYYFYIGVISFAPIAVALRHFRDPYVAASAAFGLGAAVLTLIWFAAKPVLVDVVGATASVSLTRLTFVIGFAAAILVAIGLDRRSWELPPVSRRILQAIFLVQASVLIALAVLGFVLLTMRFEDETAYATLRGHVDALWPGIVTLLLVGVRAFGLGAALVQPSSSRLRIGRMQVARTALVGALLAAELIFAWGVARPRAGVPYRLTSEVRFLQRETDLDTRAMEILPKPEWTTPALAGLAATSALDHNAPAAHGIPTANVYSSLISRDYSDTFDAFGDADFRKRMIPLAASSYMATSRFDSPLIRALGVGYLYSYKALPSPKSARQVHAGDGYYVYEVRNPLPRAFFAGRARWLPRDDVYAELGALAADDPRKVRLGPEVLLEGTRKTEGTAAYAPARVVSDSGAEVEVAVTAPRAGFLVLSDVLLPGWTATVDGSETPIEKANGFARAVRVEPGQHTVVFEYAPRSFQVGLGISVVSAIACIGLLIWIALRRRRVSPGDS